MARQQQPDEAQLLNDEFTRIFDAYRDRIDEITRNTQRNLVPDNHTPADTPAAEPEKPEAVVAPAPAPPGIKPDIPPATVKLELPAVKESEAIVKEAKRKAHQIIAEAEENIKKEAKKKTQAQVDKIIVSAQKEAEDIINKAAQAVDKERAEAVALLKQESEKVIREITEKCRQESHRQSAQIIAEAREKAAKMTNDIVTNSTEIGRQLDEIVNRAKKTVDEFETKLQTENAERSKAVSETQNKILQIILASKAEELKPELPARSKEPLKNPTLEVHLLSDNGSGKYNQGGLFSGRVEMKSASASFDYQYLKNLKKYLVHIPNIKYLQESASEREISVLFEVKEPLPLLDILRNIPLIDEVVTETDDDIRLVFKSTE